MRLHTIFLVSTLLGSSAGIADEKAPSPSEVEGKILKLVNQYRKEHDLPALAASETIAKQARQHSLHMATGETSFGHDGFRERVEVIRETIEARAWGENVAWNRAARDPAETAMRSWLNSPSHLENIEGDFTLTGIGVVQAPEGKWFFTQIFIREESRLPSKTKPVRGFKAGDSKDAR